MANSRDAFIRDQIETRERLERDGAMADGLSQPKKIAGESYKERERAREEIQSYLDKLMTNGQTDRQTDGLTELFLKSLSRLKKRKLERVREHYRALKSTRQHQRELERR